METLVGLIEHLTLWHWLGLALILLALELATGTTYLLWPAAGAAAAGLLAPGALGLTYGYQLIAFTIGTLALWAVAAPYARKLREKGSEHRLNQRALSLLGRHGKAAVTFENGQGRVHIGDSEWIAESEGDAPIREGAPIEVCGMDGAMLKVRPFRSGTP